MVRASMGPRSRDRGIARCRQRASRKPTKLQWGRGHVTAESINSRPTTAALGSASMGPRSRDRGISFTILTNGTFNVRFNGAAVT